MQLATVGRGSTCQGVYSRCLAEEDMQQLASHGCLFGTPSEAEEQEGALVAIKVIKLQRAGVSTVNQLIQASVLNEISMLQYLHSHVRSSHVVRGIAFLKRDGFTEIITELLPNAQPLSSFNKPMLRWVLRRAREVLHGLAALHAAGVVHADVKPANIICAEVTGDHHAVLVDMGSAVLVSERRPAITTPEYMAPEQALALEAAVTPAVDIWGLCCTVGRVLTGREPHEVPGVRMPADGMDEHVRSRLQDASTAPFDDSVTKEACVQRLLTAGWQRDPKQRPSAEEMLVMLERCMTQLWGSNV